MGLFWWLPFGSVPEVSADELVAMIRKEGSAKPQLLDVRGAGEWGTGHVRGAISAPVTKLGARIDALGLDRTRPIVAMCRTGGRSKVAVRLLQRHGFEGASELRGGMQAWQRAGLPVEAESAGK
ncbi:MAG: rhodanese-like domain-containing protein [Burkholderiaceae bacterium]